MKTFYLLLAFAGLLVPGFFIFQLVTQPDLSLPALLEPLLRNPVVILLGADLAVSSLVFWVFVFREAERRNIPLAWLYVLANLLFGLCFALPLFLYVRHGRERHRS